MKIFICYSHSDREWLNEIKIHLEPLKNEFEIDPWEDTRIKPGSKWKKKILTAIDDCDIAILLVSHYFLASKFITTNELPPLLQGAEEKGKIILSVIISPCLFNENTSLSQYQAINSPGKTIIELGKGKQQRVFLDLAKTIREFVKEQKFKNIDMEDKLQGKIFNFNEIHTFNKLIKIGNFNFNPEGNEIIGSEMNNFLVSSEKYKNNNIKIKSIFSLTKLSPEQTKDINAGIIFSWRNDGEYPKYFNFLFTGKKIILEKVGFSAGRHLSEHLDELFDCEIVDNKIIYFDIEFKNSKIITSLNSNQKVIDMLDIGDGHIGFRPWRSIFRCKKFEIEKSS